MTNKNSVPKTNLAMTGANIMGADHQSSMPNRNQLMKKKTDDMMHVGKPQADMKSELKSTAE